MPRLVPVVLCGGAGTRLWPLSREDRPKPLLPLIGPRTLLEETLARLDGLETAPPLVVCAAATRFQIAERLDAAGIAATVVVEPVGRGTAAAVGAAAALARAAGDDPLLLVLPSDHHVADPEAFRAAVRAGLPHADAGRLVLFAVPPTRAETGFGWIALGDPLADGVATIDAFVEKPDAATADTFAHSGRHAWNAGIFLFRASTWLDALARHAPAIAEASAAAAVGAVDDRGFVRLGGALADAPSASVDTAVIEHASSRVAVRLDAGWSDVGTFAALGDARPKDAAGNAVVGDVVLVDAVGSYVHADHRLVVGVGLRDLVVVETADAVLVAPRARAQEVRDAVERLRASGRPEPALHTDVARPWGSWTVLDQGDRHRVKRLVVRPGGSLSLQVHARRDERWVVVEGAPRITIGDDVRTRVVGDVVAIAAGTPHRLENPGPDPVTIVEVALGDVGEDDVTRLDDRYGRADRG